MSTNRVVELSGGSKVNVGPVRWGKWREVKDAFAKLLGSRLLPEVIGLATRVASEGDDDEAVMKVSAWLGDRLTSATNDLAAMLADAVANGDGMAVLLIKGCTDDIDLDTLPAADVLALAAACVEESDLPGLVGREKNLWAAVAGAATAGLSLAGKSA